jgi:hypothetical protein
VSATTNAIFGGAQGASLLVGGAVAVTLSPRGIYAIAGLLGLAAAGVLAATHAAADAKLGVPAERSPRSAAFEPTGSGQH